MKKRSYLLLLIIPFICCNNVVVDEVDMILTVKFEPDFNPRVIDNLVIVFEPTDPIDFENISGETADGKIFYETTEDNGIEVFVVTITNQWIEENLIPVNSHQYELDLPFQVKFKKGNFRIKASAFKDSNEIGYGAGFVEYPPDNIYKRIEEPLVINCHEEFRSVCNELEE